ncbi:MAG TPA: apolipoprotein N-acyltransferase [Burkholderiales bacterium]
MGFVSPFAAGAAAVLAFAPVGFFPVLLLSFAWLIHLLAHATPRRAFWLCFLFGMGLFLAGVSWVYISLSQFGGMAPPLAALATFLFCVLLAAFTGAAGWLQARIPASPALRALLLVPAAWVLGEWLRSWVLTGFPWLSAGYASTGWPLQGYAPLLGVFGISFLVVSLAGMLWFVAKGPRRVMAYPIIAFIAVVALGQALRGVDWTAPAGEPVRVALLQGNISQELKFRPDRYALTLETYASLAEQTGARLIILPETALPRFYHQLDPAYLARLEAAARRNNGDLLVGVPFRSAEGEPYNSVVSLGTAPRQLYHKTHLVPFGEFIPPLFGWINRLLVIPLGNFGRGATDQPPLAVAGQRVAVNVCYEDAFGDAIAAGAADATLLVNVSNVAWFGDSLAPAQHLQIARLRAIETGRVHLTATNTGVTAAIGRDGTVLAHLPQYATGRLEVDVLGYLGTTPYMRLGDWPVIVASLALLAGAALVAWRRQRR